MTRLYVHESGPPDAEAVVFLHGNGVSGQMWAEHMRRLSEYHCLAPDLPGFGRSNHLRWVSLSHTVDLVVDLIERRAAGERAHVVGLSLGGALVHQLLTRCSELLESALIDGAGAIPARSAPLYNVAFVVLSPFVNTRLAVEMTDRAVGLDAQSKRDLRKASPRAFRRALIESNSTNQLTPQEVGAPCRTLLVGGENDIPGVRLSNAALAALMPDAEARYVPGGGHGWIGRQPALHQRTVEAWVTASELPDELEAETTAWPRSRVRRLLEETPTVDS